MNLLQDIITYVRRIVKTPSNAVLTDNLIIDYINRFWMMDVDARIQLFDLKTKYQFQTTPGVDRYNMPLYDVQTEGGQSVGMFPVYQGFEGPAYINGVQVPLYTQRNIFFNQFPNIVQYLGVIATGDGTVGPYTLTIPVGLSVSSPLNPPVNALLRGHVDLTGVIATSTNQDPPTGTTLNEAIPVTSVSPSVYFTAIGADGANIIVSDSGQFLSSNRNYGMLMSPGNAPFGNNPLANTLGQTTAYSATQNTINYITGVATAVTFPSAIPNGADIIGQCYYFESGLPRGVLYYNNTLCLRMPPATQFLVELDAYLSPAAFMTTTSAIPFGYMGEYLARGAARKILSDTGDIEQFSFYEPLFKEQEMLVWKRSQRQFTSTRTETIYSMGFSQGCNNAGGTTL